MFENVFCGFDTDSVFDEFRRLENGMVQLFGGELETAQIAASLKDGLLTMRIFRSGQNSVRARSRWRCPEKGWSGAPTVVPLP